MFDNLTESGKILLDLVKLFRILYLRNREVHSFLPDKKFILLTMCDIYVNCSRHICTGMSPPRIIKVTYVPDLLTFEPTMRLLYMAHLWCSIIL